MHSNGLRGRDRCAIGSDSAGGRGAHQGRSFPLLLSSRHREPVCNPHRLRRRRKSAVPSDVSGEACCLRRERPIGGVPENAASLMAGATRWVCARNLPEALVAPPTVTRTTERTLEKTSEEVVL